jgi:hypothetical protein
MADGVGAGARWRKQKGQRYTSIPTFLFYHIISRTLIVLFGESTRQKRSCR